MSLPELKSLYDQEPERFWRLAWGMARRRCASLEIAGLHVPEDVMVEALETACRELAGPEQGPQSD